MESILEKWYREYYDKKNRKDFYSLYNMASESDKKRFIGWFLNTFQAFEDFVDWDGVLDEALDDLELDEIQIQLNHKTLTKKYIKQIKEYIRYNKKELIKEMLYDFSPDRGYEECFIIEQLPDYCLPINVLKNYLYQIKYKGE